VMVEADVGAGVPADEAAVFRMREIEASIGLGDKVTVAAPGDGGFTQGSVGPPVGRGATPKRKP
jgi:hypothetical protein